MLNHVPDGERYSARLAPLGAALLVVGGAMLNWFGAVLALLGILLLLICCYSKRDGLLILGPVAAEELSRRSRRKHAWLWRVFYAGGAGAIVLIEYLGHAGGYDAANMPPGKLVAANREISNWFIACFLIVVTLLSLQLFPNAIVEDRIGKRWDILRTTDLRPREILLGKLVSRLAMVLEPLFVAAPVVSVLPMYGDVSPLMVLSLLLGCVGLALSIGGIGLFYSVFAKNASYAVSSTLMIFIVYAFISGLCIILNYQGYTWAYDFVLLFGAGNPIVLGSYFTTFPGDFETRLLLVSWYFFLFHVALFWLFFLVAARRLPKAQVWQPSAMQVGQSIVAKLRGRKWEKPARLPVNRPPVTDDSIVWWERYGWLNAAQMRTMNGIRGRRLLWVAAFPWLFGLFIVLCNFLFGSGGSDFQLVVTSIMGMALAVGVGAMLCPPAFRGARCMAKERQADTYEPLILTDLEPRELLYQKWLGISLCDMPIYLAAVAIAVPAVLTGFIPFLPLLLGLAAVPFAVGGLAAVGLCVGVNAKSPFRAAVATGFVLYGLFVVAGLLMGALDKLLFKLPGSSASYRRMSWQLESSLIWLFGVAFAAAAGYAMFAWAVRRFGNGRSDAKIG